MQNSTGRGLKSLLIVFLFLTSAARLMLFSDETFTGRMRVDTEHFIFIYEERDSAAVNELVSFCEEVYREVTSFYDSYPKKIYCVIDGRVDRANASFSPLPVHLTLRVTAPSFPGMGYTADNWLRFVLTHELTHYVQLVYEKGIMAGISRFLGNEAKTAIGIFIPEWYKEGSAMLMETAPTSVGRGHDPFFELVYKSLILEESFFTYRLSGHFSPYSPHDRFYIAGYLLINHIAEQYGENALQAIQEEFVRFPFFGLDRAIRKVTGKRGAEIFEELKHSLVSGYGDDFGTDEGVRISPQSRGNYYPPVITEKGWILYRSTPDNTAAIVLYDPDSGEESELIAASLTDSYSYTADKSGAFVVYAAIESKIHPSGTTGTSDLFVVDTNTGLRSRITRDAHAWHPALSPDGRVLIAVKGLGSYSALIVVEQATGKQSLLFKLQESNVFNPVFSDDGTKIAFTMNVRGLQDIWEISYPEETFELDGKSQIPENFNSEQVIALTGPDYAGDFFPQYDRGTMFYTTDRTGNLSIHARFTDGTTGQITADTSAFAGRIAGTSLIYSSYSAQGYVLKSIPYYGQPSEPTRRPADVPPEDQTTEYFPIAQPPSNAAEEGRPYIDLPQFLFWLPVPVYYNPYNPFDLAEIQFAPGLFFISESVLGNAGVQATITSRIDVFQPGIDVNAYFNAGRARITLELLHAFHELYDGSYLQDTRESGKIHFPIISRSLYPRTIYFGVSTGLAHRFTAMSAEMFAVDDGFSGVDVTTAHFVHATMAASFEISRAGTIKDIYNPFKIAIGTNFSIPLLSPEQSSSGVSAAALASVTIPSFINHHVVRTSLKTAYTNEPVSISRNVLPRGMFVPLAEETEGRFVSALDYLFNIALFDIPLPFDLHFLQLAGGFHVETSGGWRIVSPAIMWDGDLYTGFEIIMVVGRRFYIPIGLGVNFKLTPGAMDSFSVDSNIRPYFFSSTNSFSNSY